MSRVLAHAGKGTADAIQTYFNYVNEEKGGVHGRKINLIVRDHQYEPSRSLAEFKKMVHQDNVMTLIGFGTPPTTILIEPSIEEKVLLLGINGAEPLFIPPKRYVMASVTPYKLQAVSVVTYIVEQLGVKKPKIGLYYNNDDFGREGKAGVEMAAKHYGFSIVSEAPHITGTPVEKATVTKFKAAGVNYILVGAHSGDVSGLLLEMRNQGLDCDVFGILSPASDRKIIQQAKEAAVRYYSIDTQSDWDDIQRPGIAEMIRISKKYAPPGTVEEKNFYYINAWTCALMIEEALKRAGRDLTVEGFINAVDSFNKWETGNITSLITLNPKRRVAMTGSIMRKVDLKQEHLVFVSGWIEPPAEIMQSFFGGQKNP
jgi:ABC-type branched-subunit amino acid transport system substrate-binding protein